MAAAILAPPEQPVSQRKPARAERHPDGVPAQGAKWGYGERKFQPIVLGRRGGRSSVGPERYGPGAKIAPGAYVR